MQFREFNTERGTWACGFDALLFYLAFTTFSYLFSFILAMTFEMPIHSIYMEFMFVEPEKLENPLKKAINNDDYEDYQRET